MAREAETSRFGSLLCLQYAQGAESASTLRHVSMIRGMASVFPLRGGESLNMRAVLG